MKKILAIFILMLVMVSATRAETLTIGSDADTYIRSGNGPYGSEVLMGIYGGTYDFSGYVRFDLSSLGPIQITDATLTVYVSGGYLRNDTMVTGRFGLYGLNNVEGNSSQDWDESTFTWDNAGAEWTGAVPMDESIANGRVTNLDAETGADVTETGSGSAPGSPMTVIGNDLISFVQNRVYDGGLTTFIIGNPDGNLRAYGLATKENAEAAYHPVLEITYEPIAFAYAPGPKDGSTVPFGEIPETMLTFGVPASTVTCDLYFGTEEPNALLENYGYDAAVYTGLTDDNGDLFISVDIPGTIEPSTTYYWVVDCSDGGVTTPGNIWSFFVSGAPQVVSQPALAFGPLGGSASMNVSYTTDSAIIAGYPKWYMVDGEEGIEILDSDADVTISLSTEGDVQMSTLTIANLDPVDEAFYYCVVANENGTLTTDSASLAVQRMLAHFTFDQDPNDVLGNYTGIADGDPVYAAGKVGNALVFDGENDFVTLSDGFTNFSSGLTISVWGYPTAVNNWARFLDIGTGEGVDDILFSRVGTENTLRIDFDPWPGEVNAANALVLNEWQMFVVTIDAAGNVVFYKNGLPIQTGAVSEMPTVVTRTSNFIGASNWTSDALYEGMMDDMYIFNYGITDDDVADMYAAVEGDFCRERPAYDLTGDCKVDLFDLSYLASYWLDCGFYPNPACQ